MENTDLQEVQSTPPMQIVDEQLCLEYFEGLGIAQNLKPAQKKMFIGIAQAMQLNPFKREIYAIAYGSTFSIVVGYEVYLKRGEATGLLDYMRVQEHVENGQLISATCTIKRKDQSEPFAHTVYLHEYNTNKSNWKEKPITMLKKVAMSQAYRLAFPSACGGLPHTETETLHIQQPQTLEISNIEDVLAEIKAATNMQQLKAIYEQNADLHASDLFMQELGKQKEFIKETQQ